MEMPRSSSPMHRCRYECRRHRNNRVRRVQVDRCRDRTPRQSRRRSGRTRSRRDGRSWLRWCDRQPCHAGDLTQQECWQRCSGGSPLVEEWLPRSGKTILATGFNPWIRSGRTRSAPEGRHNKEMCRPSLRGWFAGPKCPTRVETRGYLVSPLRGVSRSLFPSGSG
jgi:hypothetical protein